MSDDQLSWQERSVLEALEASLELDDPAFVGSFAAEARALDGRASPRWSARRWLQRLRHPERDG
jgi:Protein of unknown function (DUF3040)